VRAILHIITKEDALAREISRRQSAQSDLQVEVVDLTGAEPNYTEVLQKVFAADSVQVW